MAKRKRPDIAKLNKARSTDWTRRKQGRLTVLGRVPDGWSCQCECGTVVTKTAKQLRDGVKSCGCLQREKAAKMGSQAKGRPVRDLVGQVFGRLTVKQRMGEDQSGPRWLCECECGQFKIISGRKLRDGLTRSCGCLQKEVATQTITKYRK